MAQVWQVIRGSTTYTVSGGTYGYRVSAIGTGAPPKRNLTIKGPYQDGSTFVGFRYDQRNLALVFFSDTASLSLADARRDAIYNIWKGIEGQSVKVRVTRDDGSIRQIDGEVMGILDMPDEIGDRMTGAQRFAVQLECHSPFWYDPTLTSQTLTALTNTWQTAGGLIPSGNVKEYATSVVQDTAITTSITAGQPFTVFVQENTDFALTLPRTIYDIRGSSSKRLVLTLGSNLFVVADYIYNDPIVAGNATYYAVCDGSKMAIYRNNVLLADNINYSYGIQTTNSKWGALFDGSQKWPTTIDKASICDIALNGGQRAGMEFVLAGFAGSQAIIYAGQIRAYPVVEISAPLSNVVNPKIQNITTGDKLEFAYTLTAGNTIIVDCRYGYKTVKLQSTSANLIDKLTSDSDLATFSILPAGDVSGGTNLFDVTVGLTVTVKYNAQYLGL